MMNVFKYFVLRKGSESVIHYPQSLNSFPYLRFMSFKDSIKKYAPYFVDVWQYLLLILIFALAAIFVL